MAQQRIAASILDTGLSARAAVFITIGCLLTSFALVATSHAQTITVLHSFTGGGDGSFPEAGVNLDGAGNLYGTTFGLPLGNQGTAYKLSRKAAGWALDTIYNFNHPGDPTSLYAGLVVGPDGTLYGTGSQGGAYGAGAVFSLRPPATFCATVSCPWTLTNIYSFSGGSDGGDPNGNLVFDSAGNIYGTTFNGGAYDFGTAFELTRSGSGWTETVLYSFAGGKEGHYPMSGLTFDSAGNLYGTTYAGGYGTVYELSPLGSGWSETTLYRFTGRDDGGSPSGGVAFDGRGNLYGTTPLDGSGGAGTVWELSPSNGRWVFALLHSFTAGGLGYLGPQDTPTLDAAGNVYGTSAMADNEDGEVFELTPTGITWSFTAYDFNGSNGSLPVGGVTLDPNGNLYGATFTGGNMSNCFNGCGVVWEITP